MWSSCLSQGTRACATHSRGNGSPPPSQVPMGYRGALGARKPATQGVVLGPGRQELPQVHPGPLHIPGDTGCEWGCGWVVLGRDTRKEVTASLFCDAGASALASALSCILSPFVSYLRQGLATSLSCADLAGTWRPPASASQRTGITGTHHHAWLKNEVPVNTTVLKSFPLPLESGICLCLAASAVTGFPIRSYSLRPRAGLPSSDSAYPSFSALATHTLKCFHGTPCVLVKVQLPQMSKAQAAPPSVPAPLKSSF